MTSLIVLKYLIKDPTHKEMDKVLTINIVEDNPQIPKGFIYSILSEINAELTKAMKNKYVVSAVQLSEEEKK